RFRIEGENVAFRGSTEKDVARGGHHPSPRRRDEPVLPLDLSGLGLDGTYGAVTRLIRDRPSSASREAEAWLIFGIRTEIPVPLPLAPHVIQPVLGAKTRRVPVLTAGDSRPNRDAFPRWKHVGNSHRTAFGVDLLGPGLLHERVGRQVFPR